MSTSTTATELRLSDRRKNAMPLLISSFPAPPSHIPTTPLPGTVLSPLAAPNPPLSLPPSSPLPPVPGPSPVTEHETLAFISAARSRRASKMSIASSVASHYSQRDSIASVSGITPSLQSSTNSYYGSSTSARSVHSLASSTSSSHAHASSRFASDRSPLLAASITEEPTTMSIDDVVLNTPSTSVTSSPPRHLELTDTDEEESVLELGYNPSKVRRRKGKGHRSGQGMNDSISSIDMRDLPALQEDETEPLPLSPQPVAQLVKSSVSSYKSAPQLRPNPSTRARPPTAVLNKDLPPLPNTAPLASSSHSPSSSFATRTSVNAARSQQQLRPGAESPDITEILASTPRPRRKSSSHFSTGSKSRSRPTSLRKSRGSRHASDSAAIPVPLPHFRSAVKSSYSSHRQQHHEADDDEESDYGELVDGTGTKIDERMLDREVEARLERELDGFGSDGVFEGSEDEGGDSDSSIDVQTPLTNLMVRDGMLSPHSKILPQSIRAPTPYDRHLSVASVADSVMTKTGVYKDQRDTVQRRVRHRDGTLLRGGIGLTTGLGWSDSEDEDAPSALTKRISSLVLSHRTSSSSLNSATSRAKTKRSASTPQSLTRSVSDTLTSASHTLAREIKMSHPPTSWGRASTASSASSMSSRSRTSTASSVFSATSNRGRGGSESTMSLCHIKEHDADEDIATPSSASTASLPMPITPIGDDDLGAYGHAREKTAVPRKIPSTKNLKGLAYPSSMSSMPFPRERTASAASNISSSASVGHSKAITPSSVPQRAAVPRPLRLPQASGLQPKSSQGSLRMPSASARPNASNSSLSSSRTERPIAHSSPAHSMPVPAVPPPKTSVPQISRPVTPGDRKPRTGTGMVYKSSTGAPPRPTMMRVPSSTNLRSAAAKV